MRLKPFLRKQGYELETKASLNNDVKVYVNKTAKTVVFINNTGNGAEYFFGPHDDSFTSWTRISFLTDELPEHGHHSTEKVPL